jgi:RNA polymerase sigma-70 factor (ECF subfamily)
MLEDKLLIWKFNSGRREALHNIYEKYKDDLVTLAAALLTDMAAAEDVVHDVFIGFIASAGRFRLTGSLKGYLSTCVANGARNLNKAGYKRRHVDIKDIDPPVSESDNPAMRAMSSEQFAQLTWALGQLPYEQREVLILRAYSNMRFTAIAAQQNVSIDTAQGRYRYAMDKMRSLLNSDPLRPRRFASPNEATGENAGAGAEK